jgi:hypothetical protein
MLSRTSQRICLLYQHRRTLVVRAAAGEFCAPVIHSQEEVVHAERKLDYGRLHGHGFSGDFELAKK